nr:unnamed protein product [Callosobruchus chinensis]
MAVASLVVLLSPSKPFPDSHHSHIQTWTRLRKARSPIVAITNLDELLPTEIERHGRCSSEDSAGRLVQSSLTNPYLNSSEKSTFLHCGNNQPTAIERYGEEQLTKAPLHLNPDARTLRRIVAVEITQLNVLWN